MSSRPSRSSLPAMNQPSHELTPRHLLYLLVGSALLAVMGVLVFASGLIVPPWAVVVLAAVWIVAVVMAFRSWRTRMFGPLLAGIAVAVFWVIFVLSGEALFGWTA